MANMRDPIDRWMIKHGCWSQERALRALVGHKEREAIYFALAVAGGFRQRDQIVKMYRDSKNLKRTARWVKMKRAHEARQAKIQGL